MTPETSLEEAVAQCREDLVKSLVRERLAEGVPAAEILAACNRGMIELGNRFAREECFLPDLMFGGIIIKGIMAELGAQWERESTVQAAATVVMGTVQYDVHDIGKDIVVMMLRGVGFNVVDLGVDVPPKKFVAAVREHQPQVMGMSLLLTTCFKSVAATVEAIRQASLREGLSIMVGGAAASELLSANTGCDYYGRTAVDGVKYACRIAGVQEGDRA
jgi:5-methyltetrahydrofolate--homocysteine methyltransferase